MAIHKILSKKVIWILIVQYIRILRISNKRCNSTYTLDKRLLNSIKKQTKTPEYYHMNKCYMKLCVVLNQNKKMVVWNRTLLLTPGF